MSARSVDTNATMHSEFMAFAADEDSLGVIRAWAERQGFPGTCVQTGGAEMLAQMLEQAQAPKMIVVDIDGQNEPASVLERLVKSCGPDCKVIAVGSANDIGLYRRIRMAGAVDYLNKPLALETFAQALTVAARGGTIGKETREAKVIVMIGVRGGVGASTIAVNTTWLLAHEIKAQCALFDLDLQFGTSSLALDLEPGHGLRDVVGSAQRVDGLMVASSMVAESDQFSVLGAEESVEDIVPVDSGAIMALLKEMRGNFDFVVVDLPRHMLASQKRLLAAAHEIVLISELSLAGIRDTLRIKNALAAIGCAATLTLAVSRFVPSRPGQVDGATFEKGAQMKIGLVIPEDSKTVGEAANTGKAIGAIAKNAEVTKALLALAGRLSGKSASEADKKPGFLEGLLGGKPKAKTKDGG